MLKILYVYLMATSFQTIQSISLLYISSTETVLCIFSSGSPVQEKVFEYDVIPIEEKTCFLPKTGRPFIKFWQPTMIFWKDLSLETHLKWTLLSEMVKSQVKKIDFIDIVLDIAFHSVPIWILRVILLMDKKILKTRDSRKGIIVY